MAGGRPSKYSEKLADKICHRMACGESLREICQDPDMPARSTVMLWAANNQGASQETEGFSDRYARAVQARMLYHADELLDISDDASNDWMERFDQEGGVLGWQLNGEHVQRSKLRIDTRKWLLSKLIPQYADKKQLEHSGPNGGPIESRQTIDPGKLSKTTLEDLMAARASAEADE